ncbi:MAG: hypothetical protein JW982_16475 [Spirochaetes bacterium]|nr:hypothetical protein [Spirochaetota bacterium]
MDHELDILMPYDIEKAVNSSIAVIAVRPETNKIDYESVIIQAVKEYGNPVYMANLNGVLLKHKAVVIGHYTCQFQFAAEAKYGMRGYPEMIEAFEKKFKHDFNSAKIIGSLEAVKNYQDEIGLSSEELFDLMVPYEDFLEMYGHTVKKYRDFFIVDYDIPAILRRYSDSTNILIVAIAMNDAGMQLNTLNRAIYENFCANGVIKIIDSAKRVNMRWFDQVRRTYHISHNHIEAMFDLKDYVFTEDKNSIGFSDTPLGRKIFESSGMSKQEFEKKILNFKNNPLQYVTSGGVKRLAYLINEGVKFNNDGIEELSIAECCDLLSSIEY